MASNQEKGIETPLHPPLSVHYVDREHFELERDLRQTNLSLRRTRDLLDKALYLRARLEMCLYCCGHKNMCGCGHDCMWSQSKTDRYQRAVRDCDRRIQEIQKHIVHLEMLGESGQGEP